MPDFTGIEHIDALLAESKTTDRNGNGNLTRSTFLEGGERYIFDFNLGKAWMQFEAESDASYFGTWINKEKRCILCYAEGDLDFTQCKDAESFDAFILGMCKFHAPLASIRTIDLDGTLTRYYQDRRECFIDPERYPIEERKSWETDDDTDDTNEGKE